MECAFMLSLPVPTPCSQPKRATDRNGTTMRPTLRPNSLRPSMLRHPAALQHGASATHASTQQRHASTQLASARHASARRAAQPEGGWEGLGSLRSAAFLLRLVHSRLLGKPRRLALLVGSAGSVRWLGPLA